MVLKLWHNTTKEGIQIIRYNFSWKQICVCTYVYVCSPTLQVFRTFKANLKNPLQCSWYKWNWTASSKHIETMIQSLSSLIPLTVTLLSVVWFLTVHLYIPASRAVVLLITSLCSRPSWITSRWSMPLISLPLWNHLVEMECDVSHSRLKVVCSSTWTVCFKFFVKVLKRKALFITPPLISHILLIILGNYVGPQSGYPVAWQRFKTSSCLTQS
jgi:hypothetical protein